MLPLALISSVLIGFMAFAPFGKTTYAVSQQQQNENTTVGKNGSGQTNGKTLKTSADRPSPARNA